MATRWRQRRFRIPLPRSVAFEGQAAAVVGLEDSRLGVSLSIVFSRRSPARRQDYKPDTLSETLRNRILLLYREVFSGQWPKDSWSRPSNYTQEFWEEMARSLQHLYGRPKLSNAASRSAAEDALAFVCECEPAFFFDFLELTFKADCLWHVVNGRNALVDAVNEIFRIEAAPYQVTHEVTRQEPGSGRYGGTTIRTVSWPRVIRAEDEATHQEAVAPALSVLASPHFEAADLEFRDALDEYRRGHYGDCLTKCCSAFESVMKSLCNRNRWPLDEKKDTAGSLLKIIVSHSTLHPFFEQPLTLIATMRNRLSTSHGGGTSVRRVERHVAQYAITSTAAAIVLLVHEAGG